MDITTHLSELKKQFDLARHPDIANLQEILPPDCLLRFIPGTGVLQIICPDAARVKLVGRHYLATLAERVEVERIIIRSASGDHHISATVSAILSVKRSKMQSTTNTNYNCQMQKLSESIYGSSQPKALVSIETHKNMLFNDGVVALMEMSPSQLYSADLRLYWRSPEEMTPSACLSDRLPEQLDLVLRELRQCSVLENKRYSGWKANQFGVWTATIEAVQIQNEWARLMTTHDFEPIVI
jgi:hypothetical protein